MKSPKNYTDKESIQFMVNENFDAFEANQIALEDLQENDEQFYLDFSDVNEQLDDTEELIDDEEVFEEDIMNGYCPSDEPDWLDNQAIKETSELDERESDWEKKAVREFNMMYGNNENDSDFQAEQDDDGI